MTESQINLAVAGDRLMKLSEVAVHLGVSRATVYKLISTGQLPAVRVMADLRIPADAVAEFVRSNLTRKAG